MILATTSNRWSKRNRGSERTLGTTPWQRAGCWGTRQAIMFCDCTTCKTVRMMFSVWIMQELRAIYLVHYSSHTLVGIVSFYAHPHTHACMHTHTHLLTHQELAEQEGDVDKASSLAQQLEEIEERAEELDKQRTKGLSAIRSIPQINAHCRTFCCCCFNLVINYYTFCPALLFICGKKCI